MRETLYGRQAVREALRAGRRTIYRLWRAEGNVRQPILEEIAALAEAQYVPARALDRHEMARKAGSDMHQGVALEVSGYPYAQPSAMLERAEAQGEPPLLLLLDLIQDVRNLGGVLRTAEAVGVHGVVIQERRAANITPDAVNTSSGAVEHLLVARVTNLAQEIRRLKDAGVWVAGLEDAPGARCYTEVDLSGALAVVVGNEGQGLRRLVRERCDWLMSIPMHGAIESLNAAIAGSVALYEVLRQRTAR